MLNVPWNGRALPALVFFGAAATATAQVQTKSRVMVIADSSGSMVLKFNSAASAGGDGDLQSLYTDSLGANKNYFPGPIVNGVPAGPLSRMYALKRSLRDAVLSASGQLDFGLARYAINEFCPDPVNCCNPSAANPACQFQIDYTDNNHLITWAGSCGTKANGIITNGGQVLVLPTDKDANQFIERWVNNVEDFRKGGQNGFVLDPELRANGPTPLAGSVRTVTDKWYKPLLAASKNGNCDPKLDPLCDPQINCRPYALVVLTDGSDTCDDDQNAGPPSAVAALTAQNAQNPVQTYVIGLAFNDGNAPGAATLNQMAKNGGTGSAVFADNQAEIQGALSDIVARTVKFELCNGIDDTCDGVVDEGYATGNPCDVGLGVCFAKGVTKCSPNGRGVECCVQDGNPNKCTPLVALPARKEICNGVDDDCNGIIDDPPVCQGCIPLPEICDGKDNDCDGAIDNSPVDVGLSCGLNLGVCRPGKTACTSDMGRPFPDPSDHIVCLGAIEPMTEICDGQDNNCDGVTDEVARACYSGAMGTDGVGPCHAGQQVCTAGVFGACIGEVFPKKEICNGVDDDCNGVTDDLPGVGVECCPSGKCGVGICKSGKMMCSGGAIQCLGNQGPQGEVCDGLDNDCNGKVDDVPNLGKSCVPQGGAACGGSLACDLVNKQITCAPLGMKKPEICNGVDDDCDGLVDEKDPDLPMSDPNVGKACGNDKKLPLPCAAGQFACVQGKLVCQGAIGPASEVCDGIDNNCDGKIDVSAPCPPAFTCHMGRCNPDCTPTEFPCPGGFTPLTVNGKCICIPEQNCTPPCKPGFNCELKSGKCIDACAGVNCPAPLKCINGGCAGCEVNGCAKCSVCNRATHLCEVDKCCSANCAMGEFCDPAKGVCIKSCPQGCPEGKLCVDGNCEVDRCYKIDCPAGQACDSTTGLCLENRCYGTSCGQNLACCRGACAPDPCAYVRCPPTTACRVDQLNCGIRCESTIPAKKDQIVAAGGAGAGCSVGHRRGAEAPGVLVGLLLLLLALRRRAVA